MREKQIAFEVFRPALVGDQIRLYRTHRNDIQAEGHFISTLIVGTTGSSIAETFNSVYRILPAIAQ